VQTEAVLHSTANGFFQFYPAECQSEWLDTINISSVQTSMKREIEPAFQILPGRRQSSGPISFNVELVVLDQCGHPVPNLQPELKYQEEVSEGINIDVPFSSTVQTPFRDDGGTYLGT
jgi:hypothetical protein